MGTEAGAGSYTGSPFLVACYQAAQVGWAGMGALC